MTKNEYAMRTGNPKYSPDNSKAFNKFKKQYPKLFEGLKGTRRPVEWKILWDIITQHEDGRCDCMCEDLIKEARTRERAQIALEWLNDKKYLRKSKISTQWQGQFNLYELNWNIIVKKLGVRKPIPLKPLSPDKARKILFSKSEEL